MNTRKVLSVLVFLASPLLAQAEYRVFVLKISKGTATSLQRTPSAEGGRDFRLVESTLDPEQYRLYYPVAPDEVITYIDTWRCYGRTGGFTPHCPNPKGQIPGADPGAP